MISFEEEFPSLKGKIHFCECGFEKVKITYVKEDVEKHCLDRERVKKVLMNCDGYEDCPETNKMINLLLEELGL